MTMISRTKVLTDFRVQQVQAATLRVISRKGMGGATMQEIADEAGVAKGTLYLYFRDREDLLERTADYAFSTLEARIDSTLPQIPDFEGKLLALVRAQIAFFDDHREFFRIYIAMKHPPDAVHQSARRRRMCHPRYSAYLERLERMLRTAMDKGEVRKSDPARLALFVSESGAALMLRRLTEDPPPDAEEDVSWMVDILLHGIAAKGD
ncbi:MAG TPA: TetR/AcrR family transcriptional regulator [Vicinamibacteria bacterium]|nr:TetR/AcrR family transcriptional regulator [Vicinamibacteria bacterium]